MSGLIKELLLDFAADNLRTKDAPVSDEVIDLSQAISKVIHSGVFSLDVVDCLILYLIGYDAYEIAAKKSIPTNEVEIELSRILEAIEETSGYSDSILLRKLALSGKYNKTRISSAKQYLNSHGKRFMSHDI